MKNNEITKSYPEFGYTVRYEIRDDNKVIKWFASNEDGDLLMSGEFDSNNYYKSKFTLIPSNVDENVYENLFYLYFENIKLECISIVEDEDLPKWDAETEDLGMYDKNII